MVRIEISWRELDGALDRLLGLAETRGMLIARGPTVYDIVAVGRGVAEQCRNPVAVEITLLWCNAALLEEQKP